MIEVSGEFARGDVIAVRTAAGAEIARGLANYAASETRRIARKFVEIEGLLGYANEPELIHRDNLIRSESRGVPGVFPRFPGEHEISR